MSRFNTLVFDEVYYAKFAVNYLNGTEVFDAHPPLGKYFIALGIWLSKLIPIQLEPTNLVADRLLSPFSYRWLNALTGSVLPLIVAGIAYQLRHRRSYALIAGLFVTLDGFFLVESRYALINLYLVFFGLLGQWLFLLALEHRGIKQQFYLILSGISFGASVAVKWNGLGFLLGIYFIFILASIFNYLCRDNPSFAVNIFNTFKQITVFNFALNLAIVPVFFYYLAWIPHLEINSDANFLTLHEKILSYHQGMGSGTDVHPYCSRWYSWPFMLRPMSYFYEKVGTSENPVLPPLTNNLDEVIYDVHLMGNAILWWLGTLAMILLLLLAIESLWYWKRPNITDPLPLTQDSQGWIALYLVVNYGANWLPWAMVSRCTFIYLYMGAYVFALLAITWMVDCWLQNSRTPYWILGISIVSLSFIAFVFWLPLYLGLPLSPEGFQLRMWLPSWI